MLQAKSVKSIPPCLNLKNQIILPVVEKALFINENDTILKYSYVVKGNIRVKFCHLITILTSASNII